MKKINPDDLMNLQAQAAAGLLRIELAYALDDNLLFGERIYKPDAVLHIHKDLGALVIEAARRVRADHDLTLVVYDALRTVDAQQRMLESQRVKDNPHWLEEPRLLSPPGAGAHPRGMAVDLALEARDGVLLDMGTAFDYLAADSSAAKNPAHRDYPGLSDEVRGNRALLDKAMAGAAAALDFPLFPLPQEWWDFRVPSAVYEAYAPLRDEDLPEGMRCC